MNNELNELINEIPYEIRDCVEIHINKDKAEELIKETSKITDEEIEFPIKYKNIPIFIHEYTNTLVKIIQTPEKVMKAYLYEKTKLNNFLKEYGNICKKYNMGLNGCGCCGSPYLSGLYSMNVEGINYINGELEYDIMIDYDLKPYLLEKEIIKDDEEN